MLGAYIYKQVDEFFKDRPKSNLLEIGSFDGEGIASLCKKYPGSKFYSIDPFIEDGHTGHLTQDLRGDSLKNVEREFRKNTKDYSNLTHFKMTSEEFICSYWINLPDIDILIIDGDHSFPGATIDLTLAAMFARKKQIIVVMDDVCKESVGLALAGFADIHKIITTKTECPDLIYFYLEL